MNPMAQPDLHPDADVLNAFAEQALPDGERLRVVAHMAECAHCREVVFLARAAAGAEALPAPAVALEPRPGWFAAAMMRRRVALIPAGALAAIGAGLVWLGVHPVAMYKKAAVPASSAVPQPMLQAKKEAAPDAMLAKRVAPRAAAVKRDATSPQAKAKNDAPGAADAGVMAMNAAPPVRVETPGTGSSAGGAIHLDARSAAMAQYAPAPPPLPRGQAERKEELARSLSMQSPTALAAPGAAQSATAATLSQAQTARVFSSSVAAENEIPGQRIHELAYTRIAGHVKLPSGKNTVSSAAVLNRMVALDAAGGLFRSEDGGTHWIAVPVTWGGKAVEVKAPPLQVSRNLLAVRSTPGAQSPAPTEAPAPADAAMSSSADQAAAAPEASPSMPGPAKMRTSGKGAAPTLLPLFHLVTDRHELWVSSDGKEWRRRSIPPG